jgi:hypothetical protein
MKEVTLMALFLRRIAAATTAALTFTAADLRAASLAPQNAGGHPPAFRFTADAFWLNLHQFLYVLGRAHAKAPDASRRAVAGAIADEERGLAPLPAEDQASWNRAVATYQAGLSRLDTLWDRPLIEVAQALSRAGDAPSLTSMLTDTGLRKTLESAAAVYRRAFWPAHKAANEAWLNSLRPQLDLHEKTLLSFVTRAYEAPWPADGFPVHISAYTNWAGAFSTNGPVLLMSSLDPELQGTQALETAFHEAMHQWDERIQTTLHAAAKAQGVEVDGWLSHALIFYTAGEATRRAIPGHVPYAKKNGVWARGREPLRQAVEAAWQPWLDGKTSRDAAIRDLVTKAAPPAR